MEQRLSASGGNRPGFMMQKSDLAFGEVKSSFMTGLKQAHALADLAGASGSYIISYTDNVRNPK